MDRAEYGNAQETLRGIVAMLLGLAFLAERLCVVPFPVRAFVLSLLRPAGAVARAFVIEQVAGAHVVSMAAVGGWDDDGCAEALRLARCFRALASIFGRLQRSAGRRLFRGVPNGRCTQRAPAVARRGHFIKTRRRMAFGGAEQIDTS
ncbi:hypothetical protein ACSBOB_19865 [Mesorhizobium sp. ASY16-5R]|uniref:hypothetical protein n=1 Tax=Mesorhizobium sp. ASY16-5R TaxID=3445772 RepID=UPI003F9F11C7